MSMLPAETIVHCMTVAVTGAIGVNMFVDMTMVVRIVMGVVVIVTVHDTIAAQMIMFEVMRVILAMIVVVRTAAHIDLLPGLKI
ncbi:hypothetical protein QRQ56_33710 [Bradyrhizobium sp. U531]|uniref:hypothetical protein n=1 Tax=Bradyrhizobium sp. U531 TaxID=3053458 RepID=UPI003F433BA1